MRSGWMQDKKPLIIVAVIVVLAIIGGVAYATLGNTKPHDHNDGTHSHENDHEHEETATINSTQPENSTTENNSQTEENQESTSIAIMNHEYSPRIIRVKAGTTVIWVNRDNVDHNVVSESSSELKSPMLGRGESWSHTFDTPGRYDYYCTPHPYMKGTVIVTE